MALSRADTPCDRRGFSPAVRCIINGSAKDDSANKISSTISIGFVRIQPRSMHSTVEFLIKHGSVVLPAWVFAEQLRLPIRALPVDLAPGALAGTGHVRV